MTYNSAGQMIKQKTSQADATFMYAGDTQDELIQQKNGGGTTNYVFGRADQAGTPTVEAYTSTGSTTSSVTYDNDAAGQPIDLTQGSDALYIVYDGLGQTRALLKADGSVNGTINPDPWGAWFPHDDVSNAKKSPSKRVTSAAGGSRSPWTTLGIGNQAVPGFAWWKRGARWNDTTTGTWTTVDPITMLNNPNRANAYTYTGDDPINNIDPAGRWSWKGFGEAIVGGAVSTAVGGAVTGCIADAVTGCLPGAAAGFGVGLVAGAAGGAATYGAVQGYDALWDSFGAPGVETP